MDLQSELLKSRNDPLPTPAVQILLGKYVARIAQSDTHRLLHRIRHDHPCMFPAVNKVGHNRRVTSHESGPIAGEIGLLTQGIDAKQAIRGTTGNPRVQDARNSFSPTLDIPLAPAQLGVAFVGGHYGADFARLTDDLL